MVAYSLVDILEDEEECLPVVELAGEFLVLAEVLQ